MLHEGAAGTGAASLDSVDSKREADELDSAASNADGTAEAANGR